MATDKQQPVDDLVRELSRLKAENERLARDLAENENLAERSTQRLAEATAPGSIGAFAARDAAIARAEKAERERNEANTRLSLAVWREETRRALAERAGGVKVKQIDWLAEWMHRHDLRLVNAAFDELLAHLSALTTEPAAPEGQQEAMAWMDDGTLRAGSERTAHRVVTDEQKRDMPSAVRSSFNIPLYTHPAEQAVTEAALTRSPLIETLTPTGDEWERCESVQDTYDLMKAKVARAFKALGVEKCPLAEMAKHLNWELDWGSLDPSDETSECAWRVHARSGGRNDREWTLLGTGETPASALTAALAQKEGKP